MKVHFTRRGNPRTSKTDAGRLLTGTSLQVLALLLEAREEHRPPPSYTELGAGCGVGINCVFGHMARLQRAGLVEHEPGSRRAVRTACRFVPAAELAGSAPGN